MADKRVVLLSGGLDSAVVLAMTPGVPCIGFDYGQAHRIELRWAQALADHYRSPFAVMRIPQIDHAARASFIAMATAQSRRFDTIAVGWNSTDWMRSERWPPRFLGALAKSAKTHGINVKVPLFYMTKHEVVMAARKMGVPIELTWSCQSPNNSQPCGGCIACTDLREAMRLAA